MNTVYLDVLIAENMLMNFVILHITSRITSTASSIKRLMFGAAVGTAYAVIALYIETFFTALAGKLILSAFMVVIVFWPVNFKRFMRFSVFFYAVTFLFAGVSFAVLLSGNTKAVSNLLITVCLGYLLITVLENYIKKNKNKKNISANVYIQFDKNSGEGVWLPAIVDTGNSLRDPFSGKPVIIAEVAAVEDMIPGEICEQIKDNSLNFVTEGILSTSSGAEWLKRLRMIPYKAIGTENGMLTGFKADVVRIMEGGEEGTKGKGAELTGIVVCLYAEALFEDEEYKALLAPEMIA